MRSRRLKLALKLALSLGLVAALGVALDGARLWAVLTRVDPALLALAVAICAAQTALNAARWASVGGALGLAATPSDYLRVAYASFAIGQVAPSSLVADAYRLEVFRARNDWRDVLRSLV